MGKLYNLYQRKQMLDRAKRMAGQTETKDASAIIMEAHQQLDELLIIKELDAEIENFKKEKADFEKEKADFYKNIPKEIETKAKQQVGQVIENSFKNVFK